MTRRHRADCAVSAARPFALPFAALRIPLNFLQAPTPGGEADRRENPTVASALKKGRQAAGYRRLRDMGSGCVQDRFLLAGDHARLVVVCRFRFILF